jgi:hypothetical protein
MRLRISGPVVLHRGVAIELQADDRRERREKRSG